MRQYLYILIILFTGCNSQPSDGDIEKKAIKIVQQLNSRSVIIFYEWNYFNRGGDNWEKKLGDSVLYTCNYHTVADTTKLTIFEPEKFIVDFPCAFSFDTLNYWQFSLKKFKNNLVTIIGVNKMGQDITLATNQKLSTLFGKANPYDKFSSLSKFKDSLGVIGITIQNKNIGNFIEFILTRQHILTYFPDSLRIDNKYWKEEFSKGKMINKNWNYRKLNEPLDNG